MTKDARHVQEAAGSRGRRRIVLTGGPGGGKTAVLEAARARFGERLVFVPEVATIVFGGGFPRYGTSLGRKTAQLAIYRVQEQLEALLEGESKAAVTLLDRSLVDAMVYWPDAPDAMMAELGTNRAELFARYEHVLHLEVPAEGKGYDRSNTVRVESAAEASALDAKIREVWRGHPGIVRIECDARFEAKVEAAVERIGRLAEFVSA